MSNNNDQAWDGFGDVIEGSGGIFNESDGLKAYDSVRHQTTPEGPLLGGHGASYARDPQGLRCRCGNNFQRPLVSPGEVDAYLDPARRSGFLPKNIEVPLSQHCGQMAQRLGRI